VFPALELEFVVVNENGINILFFFVADGHEEDPGTLKLVGTYAAMDAILVVAAGAEDESRQCGCKDG
jgi:hypothetical protein